MDSNLRSHSSYKNIKILFVANERVAVVAEGLFVFEGVRLLVRGFPLWWRWLGILHVLDIVIKTCEADGHAVRHVNGWQQAASALDAAKVAARHGNARERKLNSKTNNLKETLAMGLSSTDHVLI